MWNVEFTFHMNTSASSAFSQQLNSYQIKQLLIRMQYTC